MKGTLSKVTLAALLWALAGALQPSLAGARVPASRAPSGAMHSHPAEHRRIVIGGWWGSPWWYEPYWDDPDWFGPYPSGPPVVQVLPKGVSIIDLDVHPRRATVTVDGTPVGQARDFEPDYRSLWVKPGSHVIELQCPGYETAYLAVKTGKVINRTLRFRLEKGTGIDGRSTAAGARGTTTS